MEQENARVVRNGPDGMLVEPIFPNRFEPLIYTDGTPIFVAPVTPGGVGSLVSELLEENKALRAEIEEGPAA